MLSNFCTSVAEISGASPPPMAAENWTPMDNPE
jgi:hypothetical protein